MTTLPLDAPVARVKRSLETLGFRVVREGNHVAMVRENADGTRTTHPRIKSSTLRTILTQARISRDDFLDAYHQT